MEEIRFDDIDSLSAKISDEFGPRKPGEPSLTGPAAARDAPWRRDPMADVPSIPETMLAAVYRERGRMTVEQRPVPVPGPQDVLLEVSHCGVCGTDLHMVMEGWGRPDSIGGHEYSGRIVALGSDNELGPADQLGPADELGSADENWKIGDAVVGGPPDPCGQ